MKRRDYPVKVFRPGDPAPPDDYEGFSPEECIGMMWQLALDTWAMMGKPVVEPRLPRNIVRVVRPAG